MTDTPPAIAALVRQRLMARTPEERFLMGVGAFEAARAMVLASFPAGLSPEEVKCRLFERFYGQPLPFRPGASPGGALAATTSAPATAPLRNAAAPESPASGAPASGPACGVPDPQGRSETGGPFHQADAGLVGGREDSGAAPNLEPAGS